jgi:hypothetical protein
MELLFLLALLLAWPTYGLSIIAWIALLILRGILQARARIEAIDRREEDKLLIEPLFAGKFAEFFRALDIPMLIGLRIDQEAAHQCGRHIMNYIAHNPTESALFIQGLKKWHTKGGGPLADPVIAADCERKFNEKGEIHLVSYRAIEALMTNNKELRCFYPIDYRKIVQHRITMEMESIIQPLN